MDHDLVVREKMTERYLLDELDPRERDQFEEHYFDCPDCALDVRAGAELIAQSKAILAETPEEAFTQTDVGHFKPARGWFAWLRPAFVVPVMAALLLVIGYQNLVTYPKLQSELHQPQVLPWGSVNVGTWGEGGPTISVPHGKGFLLFVRIPPDGSYMRYTADLYNHDGKLESSFPIPASSQQDQWPVQIPAANYEVGNYTLDVHGVTAAGESKEVGKASFVLRVQQ
jgi:Putative zinc-finger